MGLAHAMWEELRSRKRQERAESQNPLALFRDECVFRGREVCDDIYCDRGGAPVHVYRCGNPDVEQLFCIKNKVSGGRRGAVEAYAQHRPLAVCRDCHQRKPPSIGYHKEPPPSERTWPEFSDIPQIALEPLRTVEVGRLQPNEFQLNGSIIEYRGMTLFAYRFGWNSARVHMCQLDENYQSVWETELAIPRVAYNMLASEDPRLFIHDGHLWLAYTGVAWKNGRMITHVMISELDDGFEVLNTLYCHYQRRTDWEKNWGMFSHNGELFCVYDIPDQQTLSCFELPHDTGESQWGIHDSHGEVPFPRQLGLLRGGASPILHQGEYYSWCHGVFKHKGERHYQLCLYTFEARCPFKPSRAIMLPLLQVNPADRPQPHVPHCVYPAGVVLRDNRWCVSYGYYDHKCLVAEFDVNQIEQLLDPLPGSSLEKVSRRDNPDGIRDLTIWCQVFSGNEYRLPERFSESDLIVDVGAHIGAFARACLDRGAKTVVCYEPHQECFQCLKENVRHYWRECAIYNASVGIYHPLFDGPAKSDPMVPSVLDGRPVRLLKLDCEGAEYEICRDMDLSGVHEICGEAHAVDGLRMKDLQDILVAKGFHVNSEVTGVNLSGAVDTSASQTWLFWARR